MNIGSNEMSDAYSIIVNDCEKFTSLLSNVIWRPTNLTSLASASLGASAAKPSSFLCAFVFSSVTVYDFLQFLPWFSSNTYMLCFRMICQQVRCWYWLAAWKSQKFMGWPRLLASRCHCNQHSDVQENESRC